MNNTKKTSLTDAYIIKSNSNSRKENDYYPTAPLATESLIHFFKDVIPKNIWEPAAGRGWISKTLIENGYNVHSTDLNAYDNSLLEIKTNKDFLKTEKPKSVQGIITNPPYKNGLAQKFVEKSINEADFCAFFLRLTFMESMSRYELFKENPPSVLVFSRRMNCEEEKFDTYKGQMGGMVAYAWFVWSKKLQGGTINWIDSMEIVNEKEKAKC